MGSEINDRDKGEQVTEKIDEIRKKIKVIIENDSFEGGLLGNEFIDIFRQVENNDNQDQQGNRIEKCTQELFNDIVIDGFHRYFSSIYAIKIEKLSEPPG
jgi:hypothetical protein